MLVKNSACWAVSKYSHWIIEQDAKQYLEPYLYILLQLMVDKRKKVQSAACSSLSYLLSTTRFDLILYFDALVSTFVNAFSIYQVLSFSLPLVLPFLPFSPSPFLFSLPFLIFLPFPLSLLSLFLPFSPSPFLLFLPLSLLPFLPFLPFAPFPPS